MPIENVTTTWECEHCYREFDDEDDCAEHEDKCERNPDYSEITDDAVTPLCNFCEHCTKEGYRSPECKLLYPDKSVRQCSLFQPARDLN